MEAIRIIKEMRRATNGNYPKFAIFENVTGIFSSNHGEDFRVVLEEFIKIVEPRATMSQMPRGGWPYADCYVGDGWSIAYRTFDTQYWGKTIRDPVTGVITQRGTPQRRRRLYLTACFTSECAHKILFEREGLQGDHTQGESPWKGIAADAGSSSFADDKDGELQLKRSKKRENTDEYTPMKLSLFESHAQDIRYKGPLDVCPVISAKYGTGGLNQPFIVKKTEFLYGKSDNPACVQNRFDVTNVLGFDGYNSNDTGDKAATLGVNCGMSTGRNGVLIAAGFKAGQGAKAKGIGWQENISPTLAGTPSGTNQVPAVYISFTQNQRNEVRNLNGVSGALAANHGMKQQTYIVEQIHFSDQQSQLVSESVIPLHDKATRYKGGGPSRKNDGSGNGLGIGKPGDPFPTLTAGDRHSVAYLASGKDKTGTLMANAGTKQWLGNQEAFSGDYHIIEEHTPCYSWSSDNQEKSLHLNRPADTCHVFCQSGFATYSDDGFAPLRASGADCGNGAENLIVSSKEAPVKQDAAEADAEFSDRCTSLEYLEQSRSQVLKGELPIEPPDIRYIVRRLTPTECARLQGFPDTWGYPDAKDNFTDEEYAFWLKVRNEHGSINGKKTKDYTKKQMLTWYNKLHSDAAEYRMWGNGLAIPPTLYCMQGICEVYHEMAPADKKTE